ncbi:MAG: FkbM family methyltransferase [Pseudomonadota bacterium]
MTAPQRQVFLDVGGHRGQTLEEVLTPKWAFDVIFCFEPDPECFAHIESIFAEAIDEERLIVINAGLSDESGDVTLYGDNSGGGASALHKHGADDTIQRTVAFLDVCAFLDRHMEDGDAIYMKLNCEGAETAILNRLAAENRLAPFAAIMADFDITKTKGGLMKKIAAIDAVKKRGFSNLDLSEAVMVGKTHQERIRNWLLRYPELRRTDFGTEFAGERVLPQRPSRRVKYALRDLRSLFL